MRSPEGPTPWIELDAGAAEPLYAQLYEGFWEAVLAGRIAVGGSRLERYAAELRAGSRAGRRAVQVVARPQPAEAPKIPKRLPPVSGPEARLLDAAQAWA